MKMKKWLAGALAAVCLLSASGCGAKGTAVYVQSVSDITGMGSIALGDRFPGMVVSENVTEVKKDAEKTVAELKVKEGDDVREGQELFSYDSEEIQLNLDKQKLEQEKLQASLDSYKDQVKTLQAARKATSNKTEQARLDVEIADAQLSQKTTEMDIAAKKKEISQSQDLLKNISVKSPVAGRVQSINESGQDNMGNPVAYITIQQTGSYRIKGTLGELQRGGVMEGTRVKIVSRMDENQFWMGTVTLVDYENATQGSGNNNGYVMMDGGSDGSNSSSKYPFYVELDSSEGLILGQHVYMELDIGEGESTGLQLPSSFVVTGEDGVSFVWAEGKNSKLEKRTVTLGALDEMMGTYEILEGLTAEDYIAFPNEELCKAGAATTHEYVEPEGTDPMAGDENNFGDLDNSGVNPGEFDGADMPEDGGDMDGMIPEGGEIGGVAPEGGIDDSAAQPDADFSMEG